MENRTITQEIERGDTALGIELGSTRIKAVLVNDRNEIIAQGGSLLGEPAGGRYLDLQS